MEETIPLPARLDGASVQVVADELCARRAHPVALDASRITVAGALGVQLLVAARRQWRADGAPFCVQAPTGALLEACRLLGVAPAEIGAGSGTEGAP